jgi:pimeloyl-ACP methyl ester carboxylesterase
MIRSERIVIFGRSLGAAVAGELAEQKPAVGLILESAFPSIGAVAKFHYGGLPVHWLLGADFALIDRLPQLSLPKLIIHGDKDDIIPLELGRQVFEAAKPPITTPTRSGARPISADGQSLFKPPSGPSRTLGKSASQSCSFGLFGLSNLSRLFGLSCLFG